MNESLNGNQGIRVIKFSDPNQPIYNSDTICPQCGGSGSHVYPNTLTWREGEGMMSGQALTPDVCDVCWGSGAINRPGPNLRLPHADLSASVSLSPAAPLLDSAPIVEVSNLTPVASRRQILQLAWKFWPEDQEPDRIVEFGKLLIERFANQPPVQNTRRMVTTKVEKLRFQPNTTPLNQSPPGGPADEELILLNGKEVVVGRYYMSDAAAEKLGISDSYLYHMKSLGHMKTPDHWIMAEINARTATVNRRVLWCVSKISKLGLRSRRGKLN